jgi:hypothetical protein
MSNFLRISDRREGRVTLVLDGSAAPVTSLRARMTTTVLATARQSLRARERVIEAALGWTPPPDRSCD